jgi:hypothetical protein
MKIFYYLPVIFFLLTGCKQKKKDKNESESFFPVVSFIKSQVAHVDTSLYPIMKITWMDSVKTDTSFIPREDFKTLAKDFLEIPDITDKRYSSGYKEDKYFDEDLNQVSLIYKPKEPNHAIIQLQEVQIEPSPTGDKVKSMYIQLIKTNKDSTEEKKLLWVPDKSFQVYSVVQKPEQPERVIRFQLQWNVKDE